MSAMVSQITSLTIVYSTVYSDADQRKHESSASLAFVRRIHRGPMNSSHKWSVTRKMFPFNDFIMLRNINIDLNESRLGGNFVDTGGTGCCHFDNLRPCDDVQSWNKEDSHFPVRVVNFVVTVAPQVVILGLALLMLSWDKNMDN